MADIGSLTFEKPNHKKFPALNLVKSVLKTSGGFGVVFNAAKEIALDRFIAKEIGFLDMSKLVEKVMASSKLQYFEHQRLESVEDVISLNQLSRQIASKATIC